MYVKIELESLLVEYFLHGGEIIEGIVLGDGVGIVLKLESFFGEA